MYDNKFFDAMGQAERQAAAGLVRANFGKFSVSNVQYIKFTQDAGGGWTAEEIELDEYRNLQRGTAMKISFGVDIQEFNTNLDWAYERTLRIGGADWRKTFVPSVEAVYGEGSMSTENRTATLGKLIGSYVETHDVPQQPQKKDKHINASTGEPYRTMELVKVYGSRKECYAAYKERFGEAAGKDSGETVATEPTILTADQIEAIQMIAADLLQEGKSVTITAVNVAKEMELTVGTVKPVVAEYAETFVPS